MTQRGQQKVELVVTAQQAQAIQGMMDLANSMKGLDRGYETVGKKGKTATDMIGRGWQNVGAQAGYAALGLIGVQSASQAILTFTNAIANEWQNIVDIQRQASDRLAAQGQATSALSLGILPGSQLNPARVLELIRGARVPAEFGEQGVALTISAAVSAGQEPSLQWERARAGQYIAERYAALGPQATEALATASVRMWEAFHLMAEGYRGRGEAVPFEEYNLEEWADALRVIADVSNAKITTLGRYSQEMATAAQTLVMQGGFEPMDVIKAFLAFTQQSGDESGRRVHTQMIKTMRELVSQIAARPELQGLTAAQLLERLQQAGPEDKVARAVAGQLAGVFSPMFEDLESMVEEGLITQRQYQRFLEGGPVPRAAWGGMRTEAKTALGAYSWISSMTMRPPREGEMSWYLQRLQDVLPDPREASKVVEQMEREVEQTQPGRMFDVRRGINRAQQILQSGTEGFIEDYQNQMWEFLRRTEPVGVRSYTAFTMRRQAMGMETEADVIQYYLEQLHRIAAAQTGFEARGFAQPSMTGVPAQILPEGATYAEVARNQLNLSEKQIRLLESIDEVIRTAERQLDSIRDSNDRSAAANEDMRDAENDSRRIPPPAAPIAAGEEERLP